MPYMVYLETGASAYALVYVPVCVYWALLYDMDVVLDMVSVIGTMIFVYV